MCSVEIRFFAKATLKSVGFTTLSFFGPLQKKKKGQTGMIEQLLSLCSGYTDFLFFCGFEMIFVQIWTLDTQDLRALHHSGLLWFNSLELLRWAVWTRSKDSRGGGDYLILKKKKRPNFEDRNVLNIEKKKKAQDLDENILERLQVKVKVPLIITYFNMWNGSFAFYSLAQGATSGSGSAALQNHLVI